MTFIWMVNILEKQATRLEKCQDENIYDARRRLEDRLEASRIQKQTRDYDFDLLIFKPKQIIGTFAGCFWHNMPPRNSQSLRYSVVRLIPFTFKSLALAKS